MKICAACSDELPKDTFSKKQWQLAARQRRCKECIAANREVQEKRTPIDAGIEGDEEGAACWICLCERDEAGEPTVRDCSCRGTAAGYHTSCVVSFAKAKSGEIEAAMDNPFALTDNDKRFDPFGDKFVKPWTTCPNYKQNYRHGVALELADALISFIGKIETFRQRQDSMDYSSSVKLYRMITALKQKIIAIDSLYKKNPQLNIEGKKTAYKLLTLVESAQRSETMKDEYPEYEHFLMTHELIAYGCMGAYLSSDGSSKKDRKKAIQYYERMRSIFVSLGNKDSVAVADAVIERCNKNNQVSPSVGKQREAIEIMLKSFRSRYEEGMKKEETKAEAIQAGHRLARRLLDLDCDAEAKQILTKIAPISCRIHGADHKITKDINGLLKVVCYIVGIGFMAE